MQARVSKIVVLGTGGTIAGTAPAPQDNLGYRAARLGVDSLLASLPALHPVLHGITIVSEQVAQIDSKDMGFDTLGRLAARCAYWMGRQDVQGVVITHGTDTLEETALFLQIVLAPDKPLVLTCAMRPATSLSADGPQNLLDALAVAAAPGAQGVVAVCAGVIHGAWDVAKIHPYRLDAFASGDAGPIGHIEESRLALVRNWPQGRLQWPRLAIESIASTTLWPRVEIVMNHVGAGAGVVEALMASGVDGLVVAGTGNGTLSTALESALLKAQSAGIRVVRSTRCPRGRVLAHAQDTLPDSRGLSPVKARIALVLELLARRG